MNEIQELLEEFINHKLAITNITNEDELKRLDKLIKEQTTVVEKVMPSGTSCPLNDVAYIACQLYKNKAAVVFGPEIHRFLYCSTNGNKYPYVPLDEFLDAVENTNIPTTNPEEWMCLLNV